MTINSKETMSPHPLFSCAQNDFLLEEISKGSNSNNDKIKWKEISKSFNLKFPNAKKTGKQIKNHYNNVLNQNFKNDD
jgi:hypothetical protein